MYKIIDRFGLTITSHSRPWYETQALRARIIRGFGNSLKPKVIKV